MNDVTKEILLDFLKNQKELYLLSIEEGYCDKNYEPLYSWEEGENFYNETIKYLTNNN